MSRKDDPRRRQRNSPGLSYVNIRDASRASVSVTVPVIVKRMWDMAKVRGDYRLTDYITEYMYKAIREQLGEAEYSAMMEYLDKYYPPSKSPEAKAYWRQKLTGQNNKPGP